MSADDTGLTGTSESDSSAGTDMDEFSNSSLSDSSITSDGEFESDSDTGASQSTEGPGNDGNCADDEMSDSDLDPILDMDESESDLGVGERIPLGRWVWKEITAMYAQ